MPGVLGSPGGEARGGWRSGASLASLTRLLDDYLDGEVAELDRVLQQIDSARTCLRTLRAPRLSPARPAGSSECQNLGKRSQSSVAASADLATAIRLQARGYQVHLLEARDKLGGRAYVYEQDGFKFDAGPTVITAPFLIDEIFEAAGRKTADYVDIVPVDPFYRIEFHDGRCVRIQRRRERNRAARAPGSRRAMRTATGAC